MQIFTRHILLLVIVFLTNNILHCQPAKIVDVTQQWTNTGIILSDSQAVTIYAQGYATWNNYGNKPELRDWFTPSGLGGNYIDVNSSFPCPTCPAVSLIAKIGENSTPQFIGISGHIGSYEGGTLYLGVNDPVPEDNYGSFIALIFIDAPTPVENERNNILIDSYNLSQNYPNPFNPSTTIEYTVQAFDNIQIKIYNSLGQLIKTLVNETKTPGEYLIVWNGKDDNGSLVASGAYFYQIQTKDFVSSKKMILLK
jgi:hypothetical protein